MELVKTHKNGGGIDTQRCELKSTDGWFRGTGCHIKVDFFYDYPSCTSEPKFTALQRDLRYTYATISNSLFTKIKRGTLEMY